MAIGGAFVAIAAVVPGPPVYTSFSIHLSGIALGIGVGWLIKSVIDHAKGVPSEKKSS